MPSVGKGNLWHAIFQLPQLLLSCIKVGLGPETLPCQEIKSLYSLSWVCHLLWKYFSLFHAQWMLFSSANVCMSRTLNHALSFWYFRLYIGELGSFCCSTRLVWVGQLPYVSCWVSGQWVGSHERWMHTIGSDLAVSSIEKSKKRVSKALLHLVLDCTVFSMATLIPRCNEWKC